MRQNRLFVFSLSLMLASSMVKAQEVKPSLLEYWFDTHIEQRQSFAVNGDLSQQIDISQLCTGIHTLEMRVGDTKGRWGAPVVKYFLKNNPVSDRQLTAYRYWIDNMSGVKEGTTSTGDVMLDIDVAKLSKGIHSLNYQVVRFWRDKNQCFIIKNPKHKGLLLANVCSGNQDIVLDRQLSRARV